MYIQAFSAYPLYVSRTGMSDAMPSSASVPGLISLTHLCSKYERTCLKQITQTAFYENEELATPFYICALLQESVTPLR